MTELQDKIKSNQERMDKLTRDGLTIDFTPPRVEHLTDQVFNETWATVEDWELAWQDKVADLLDQIEPQVAKAKLAVGNRQLEGQLSLVQ